jgi:hypothetical protein
MKTWKKIAVVGTVAIGAMGFFAFRKAQQIKQAFEKVTFSVGSLSNFDISLQRVRFNVKLNLTNHSLTDFVISSFGSVKLQRIVALDKQGKVIGTAEIQNLSEIKVGGYNTVTLPEVTFNIPLSEALKIITTQELSSLSPDAILKFMNFALVFDVKGNKVEYITE